MADSGAHACEGDIVAESQIAHFACLFVHVHEVQCVHYVLT